MASEIDSSVPFSVYQPGEDWETLIGEADEILGYDLAKDETADDLVGVPFAITRVIFRAGVLRDKERAAYVSCETVIAPSLDLRTINSRRASNGLPRLTDLDALAFGPGSHVVFNDGSTGVYRQIVKYLSARGFIELEGPIVEAGSYGESSFDQPPNRWANIHTGESKFDPDGFMDYDAPIRLYCPRGLRLSEYQNDYTQTGKTRYLG